MLTLALTVNTHSCKQAWTQTELENQRHMGRQLAHKQIRNSCSREKKHTVSTETNPVCQRFEKVHAMFACLHLSKDKPCMLHCKEIIKEDTKKEK